MFEIDPNFLIVVLGALGIGAILKSFVDWLLGGKVRRENLSGDERENLRQDVVFLRGEIKVLRGEISTLKTYLDKVEINVNQYRREIAERNQLYWIMVNTLNETEDENLRQAMEEIAARLERFVIQGK